MTVDGRAIRMAQDTARLAGAMRRYVEEQQHDTGGCADDPCVLCVALAQFDRRTTKTTAREVPT